MTRILESRAQRSSTEIPAQQQSTPYRVRAVESGVGSRRHVTRAASASEIRKALGISKKDLDTARKDLALLGVKNTHP